MNKKRFLSIIFLLTILTSFLTIPIQAASGNEGLRDSKPVRIACGMNGSLYFDESGEPAGLALPLIRQIAWNAGWKLEYVPGSYSDSLRKLGDGDIDLMFSVGKSEDPDGKLLYSNFDGGIQQIGLFAREDADLYYEDFTNFDGKRVALSPGGNSIALDAYAKQHHFSYEQVTDYNDVPTKIDALMNGDVDMVAFSTLNSVSGGKMVAVLDQLPVYFCTSKEEPELYQELNDAISLAMINTPDVVSQCAKDMMTGTAVVSLTREEYDKIESTGTIKFGVYSHNLPLAGVNSDGECVGIYVDTIKEIARKSGLTIEVVPVEDDRKLYSYLDDGTVDFVMSLFDLRFYAENADNYLISNGISEYVTVAVTDAEYQFENDDSLSVALTESQGYMIDFINANFPNAAVTYYGSRKACMEAVEAGKADAAFMSTWEFNYESKNERFANLIEWENIRRESTFAIGATKDSDLELLSILEKTISQLPKETITQIIAENLNMHYDSYTLADQIYLKKDILIIGTITVLLLLIALWFYLRMTHKRTDDYKRVIGYVCTACDSVAELNLKTHKIKRYVAKDGLVQEKYVENQIERMFFVDPEERKEVEALFSKEAVRKIIENGEAITFECRMKWNEADDYRWNTCIVQGILPNKEHPYNLLMIIRDIHEMRQKEEDQKRALEEAFEKATQADQSKGQFLSRMSHELRTPLNAISGYAAVMDQSVTDHKYDEAKTHFYLESISRAVKYQLAILGDLLDIQKIESGKMELVPTETNSAEFLGDIVAMIEPEAKEKGVAFAYERLTHVNETYFLDGVRLQQVLLNLLHNAVKFTPAGGSVKMTAEVIEQHDETNTVKFVISDTGIGMSEEFQRNYLFHSFAQEYGGNTSPYEGCGTGLAISKNIIQLMGGEITCDSKQGEGSTFTVIIPAKHIEKKRRRKMTADYSAYDLSGIRVLLCEDNEMNQDIERRMLEKMHCVVDIAADGKIGTEMFEQSSVGTYDIVLMDIRMPNMDGYEATRTIRAMEREDAKTIPILAVSANSFEEDVQNSLASGMNEHLSKPVDVQTMYEKITRYCKS